MTTPSVFEANLVHAATCRARRQQLVCSVCVDLAERVAAALAGIRKAAA